MKSFWTTFIDIWQFLSGYTDNEENASKSQIENSLTRAISKQKNSKEFIFSNFTLKFNFHFSPKMLLGIPVPTHAPDVKKFG